MYYRFRPRTKVRNAFNAESAEKTRGDTQRASEHWFFFTEMPYEACLPSPNVVDVRGLGFARRSGSGIFRRQGEKAKHPLDYCRGSGTRPRLLWGPRRAHAAVGQAGLGR